MLVIYNAFYVGLINYGVKLTGDRDLTKDCITQVLLKIWEKRATQPAVENVRAYLVTCLHNELISEIRGQANKAVKHRQMEMDMAVAEEPYEEALIRLQHDQAIQQEIREAFQELTPRQRQLLQLRYFDNLSYDEIAQECDISKRTAYNIVQKGLLTLKKHLVLKQPDNPLLATDILLSLLPFLLFSEIIIN